MLFLCHQSTSLLIIDRSCCPLKTRTKALRMYNLFDEYIDEIMILVFVCTSNYRKFGQQASLSYCLWSNENCFCYAYVTEDLKAK